MSITRVCYCTREQVKAAVDVAATAYADTRVDRAIESSSDNVDGLCHRRFWPWTGTRYFDWPDPQSPTPWRLWLDDNGLVSVSALVAGGTAIGPSAYFLRRSDSRDEPPYTHLEINLASQSAFAAGSTRQRAVAVTGVWCGADVDTTPGGALAEDLDASETAVDVTDSAAVGVGDLVAVGSERMLVTGKAMLTTGQVLGSPALTASAANVSLTVTTGSAYSPGETILLDSERMLILDVAGNVLTVRRAFDGTVLAAHTGSTVYAPRTLTVVRGYAGTAAATHNTSAAVARHVAPALVRDLALAYALNQFEQEAAGYARTAGAGDHLIETLGRGVKQIEADCYQRHGRKARTRAV
jgi:hypothetical protein